MNIQLKKAQAEIALSRKELANISNKLAVQHASSQKKVQKNKKILEATMVDGAHYEDVLLSENKKLSELINQLKKEFTALSGSNVTLVSDTDSDKGTATFCFRIKDGSKVYTTAIRELYYTLLADQLPPAKIASMIKTILKTFLPSINVDKLHLPGESCASYMRREELTTINLAHKASCLAEQAKSGCVNLNSDGTTKSQKKLQGTAINDIVISVNEVLDGSADSMIAD